MLHSLDGARSKEELSHRCSPSQSPADELKYPTQPTLQCLSFDLQWLSCGSVPSILFCCRAEILAHPSQEDYLVCRF
ncbi:hypothetical protein CHARACLAT_030065 [Characodon lateralis]|uniref:Uncharacterized protein n=1 Tax=Characodon lateralis TaxID=208331 RepID=A0ABU7DMX4_9TELE|nr:hypothetical protein [Characodon lateralis]